MTLRSALAAKIPHLYQVTFVNDAELATNINRGVMHRFLTACDVAWGVWGGPEPCTTISSRTAYTLMEALNFKVTKAILPWSEVPEWYALAPLWALALGALLETIDPGHLQGAMIADVSRQVGGMCYLTGIRVLSPPLRT